MAMNSDSSLGRSRLSCLAIVILAFLLFAASVMVAQGNPVLLTVGTGDVLARAGQEITVPITVETDLTGRNIVAGQFDVLYDPSLLIGFRLVRGGLLEGASGIRIADNRLSDMRPTVQSRLDTLRIVMAADEPLNGSGVLAFMRFTVRSDAQPGESSTVRVSSTGGKPVFERVAAPTAPETGGVDVTIVPDHRVVTVVERSASFSLPTDVAVVLGRSVDVPVRIWSPIAKTGPNSQDPLPITSAAFRINYDSSVLRFVGVSAGLPPWRGGAVAKGDTATGSLLVAIASAEDVVFTSGDVFLVLQFKAIGPQSLVTQGGTAGEVFTTVSFGDMLEVNGGSVVATGTAGIVRILPIAFQSISVSPASASVPAGETQQFRATGWMSDSTSVTTGFLWFSSDGNVAAIDLTSGLATGTGPGTTTITASREGLTGKATLNVAEGKLVSVKSVVVEPPSARITAGLTQQFTARVIATFTDKSERDVTGQAQITWNSSNPAVATVSPAGVVTGVSGGSADLTADVTVTVGSITSSGTGKATVTVQTGQVNVVIDPPFPTLTAGLILPLKAHVTATLADGQATDATNQAQIVWTSSNPSIATVDPVGVLAGVTPGSVQISATATVRVGAANATGTGTATATVKSGLLVVTVEPSAVSLTAGLTQSFTARVLATMADGQIQDMSDKAQVDWTVDDPKVARINQQGNLTGLGPGIARVNAEATVRIGQARTSGTGVAVVTVQASELRVTVDPPALNLTVGMAQPLSAHVTVTMADGQPLDVTDEAQITWTSGDPGVAAVGPSGVVVALSDGLASISARATITVGTAAVTGTGSSDVKVKSGTVRVVIDPGTSTVSAGLTQRLRASVTLTRADGQVTDVSDQAIVSWTSADPKVAVISPDGVVKGLAPGRVDVTASAMVQVGAAAVSGAGTSRIDVTAAQLSSIQVELKPESATFPVGSSGRFDASIKGTFTDGTSAPISATLSWAVTKPEMVRIDPAPGQGVQVTALQPGQTALAVTATALGVPPSSAVATIEVKPAEIASLDLSLNPKAVTLSSGRQDRIQVSVTAKFTSGEVRDLTEQAAIAWTSSSPAIAAINPFSGSSTQVTGVSPGTAVVTATVTAGGKSKSLQAIVTIREAELIGLGVAVNPLSATIAAGQRQRFTATAIGKFSDGDRPIALQALPAGTPGAPTGGLQGPQVRWTSSNPGVATVAPGSGDTTNATGVATGTSSIGAVVSYGGKSAAASAELQVTPSVLNSIDIAISPPGSFLSLGQTQQLLAVASGSYSDGSRPLLPGSFTIIWETDSPRVATVNPITGLVTAVGAGNAAILATAASQGKTASARATVTVSEAKLLGIRVNVLPPDVTIPAGKTQAFRAEVMGSFTDGDRLVTAQATLSWASSSPEIASVGPSGEAKALSAGAATITATATVQGVAPASGTARVTVSAAALLNLSVDVSPKAASVAAGKMQGFSARVLAEFSDGKRDATAQARTKWASADTRVATVDKIGMVTAVSPGQTEISASADLAGKNAVGVATVTVSEAELQALTIEISPQQAQVAAGRTQQFTAKVTGEFSSGKQDLTSRAVVVWVSENANAVVNPQGLATAGRAGEARITATATYQGKTVSATARLVVQQGELQSVTLEVLPTSATVFEGGTRQFAALLKGTYTDGVREVTQGAPIIWRSLQEDIAAIDPKTGQATAKKEGTATIEASVQVGPVSATGSATLLVSRAQLLQIVVSVTPPVATVFAGKTQGFSAVVTGQFTNGTRNITSEPGLTLAWSSEDRAVSSVDPALGTAVTVTGLSEGKSGINVTATFGGVEGRGSAALTVQAAKLARISAVVTPSSAAMSAGETLPLEVVVTGTLTDGTTSLVRDAKLTWGSDSPTVAVVSPTGAVRAMDSGNAKITVDVASGKLTASAAALITVAPPTLTGLQVVLDPQAATVTAGSFVRFAARVNGVYSSGLVRPIPQAAVTWAADPDAVASIDAGGVALGLKAGMASVTARASVAAPEGTMAGSATAVLTVGDATLTAIGAVAEPPTMTIPAGGSGRLAIRVTASFSDGSHSDATPDIVEWSSDKPGTVDVDKQGVVFGKKPGGPVKVTASVIKGDLSATATVLVTVGEPVLEAVAVAIDPAQVSLEAGRTAQLKIRVDGRFSDGSIRGVPEQARVSWNSSAPAVASVTASGQIRAGEQGVATIAARVTVGAFAGEGAATVSVVEAAASGIAVKIQPASATVAAGQSQLFSASVVATMSDGSARDVTGEAKIEWTSEKPTVAALDAAGAATGLLPGDVKIFASALLKGQKAVGSAQLTVGQPTLESIIVESPGRSLPVGRTQQFRAYGMFSSGRQEITQIVQWNVTDPLLASVNKTGLVTGLVVGTTDVVAVLGDKQASGTVSVGEALLLSISVSPRDPIVARGQTQAFTVDGAFTDGVRPVASGVTWSSGLPSVAAIDADGLVTGLEQGATEIRAAVGDLSSPPSRLSVTEAQLVKVGVSGPPTVPKGSTVPYSAVGTYSDGSKGVVTSGVSWTSSSPDVLSLDDAGGATGLSVGASDVVATVGGVSSSASRVTVTPPVVGSLRLVPSEDIARPVGVPVAYAVMGLLTDGTERELGRQVEWASSDLQVAVVDKQGRVEPQMAGSTRISASFSGFSASNLLTVVEAVPRVLRLDPARSTLVAGQAVQLSARVILTDGREQDVTSDPGLALQSTDPAVASIDASGRVTGVAVGQVDITAQLGEIVSKPAVVVVTEAALEQIRIMQENPVVAAGLTVQLLAEGRFSDGSRSDITRGVTWQSDDAEVASIDANGLVTALKRGKVKITASRDAIGSPPRVLTVDFPRLVSVSISPTEVTLAAGDAQSFTATASFSDRSARDVTQERRLRWVSVNPAVAVIDAAGRLTGKSPGTTEVSAALEGMTSDASKVTITSPRLTSLTVSPPPTRLAVGEEWRFAVTGVFSDGSRDLTSVAVWQVSGQLSAFSPSGQTVASSSGAAEVTASYGGLVSAPVRFFVDPPRLLSLALAPRETIVSVGAPVFYEATATYTDKSSAVVTEGLIWKSDNEVVGTIDEFGTLVALAPGTATITAESEGVVAMAKLTVTAPAVTLSEVLVTPVGPGSGSASVALGDKLRLLATARFSDGAESDVTGQAVWESSDAGVATVGASGDLVPVSPGSVEIRAAYGGLVGSVALTVTPPRVVALRIFPRSATLAIGERVQFAATAIRGDSSRVDVTDAAQWSSSDPAVMSVDEGVATGLSDGTVAITAVLEGVSRTRTIVVDGRPPRVVALSDWKTTDTVASMRLETDEESSLTVEYGLDADYGLGFASVSRTSHSVTLTGLSPLSVYHYRLVVADAKGNASTGEDRTFTTLAAPDLTPPRLVGVPTVMNTTDETVSISIATDDPSAAVIVQYGETDALGLEVQSDVDDRTLEAVVRLSGLSPSTTYLYRVGLRDPSGNTGYTDALYRCTTKETPDRDAPVFVVQPTIVSVTENSVVLLWETNEPASAVVEVGATPEFELPEIQDGAFLKRRDRFELRNLLPSTPYYVRVSSTDQVGNGPAQSQILAVQTLQAPDRRSPVVIGQPFVDALSDGATVSWSTDEVSTSIVEYGRADGIQVGSQGEDVFPSRAELRSLVPEGQAHIVLIGGLEPSVRYRYGVSSSDASGNVSARVGGEFVTQALPDLSAPVITVRSSVIDIGQTSATVLWGTDEPANSVVEYGLSPDLVAPFTAADPSYATEHRVALVDLLPGTTYYFRIHTTDARGNGPTYGILRTLSTAAAPDTRPPVVADPVVSAGVDQVTVTWGTDESTLGLVRFGTGATLDMALTEAGEPGLYHSLTVVGLSPETQYGYTIEARDGSGNVGVSPQRAFRTLSLPDETPPSLIGMPVGEDIDVNAAFVRFAANEPSSALVEYGLTADYGGSVGSTDLVGGERRIRLTNLEAGSNYHYRITIIDRAGNSFSDADRTFRTSEAPDVTPPVITAGPIATAISPTEVIVSYETDEASSARVEYGLTTAYGSTSPTMAEFRTIHLLHLVGMEPGTLYHCRVVSEDVNANGLVSGDLEVLLPTMPDQTPPAISRPVVSVLGDQALVSWATSEDADGLVKFGTSPDSLVRQVGDTRLSTTHSVTLGGLTPNTTYLYRVESADGSRNVGVFPPSYDPPERFETLPEADTNPPVLIEGPFVPYRSDTDAIVAWKTDELSDSHVFYKAASDSFFALSSDPAPTTDHSVRITNLVPGQPYQFGLISLDAAGNELIFPQAFMGMVNLKIVRSDVAARRGKLARMYEALQPPGGDGSFETELVADLTPPAILTGPTIVAVTKSSATLEWQTDEAANSDVRYGVSAQALPSGKRLGAAQTELLVSRKQVTDHVLQHRVTLTGLSPATQYLFKVASTDPDDNGPTESLEGVFSTATEQDLIPPRLVSGPSQLSVTDRQATLSWQTDELTDTVVEYWEDGKSPLRLVAPDPTSEHRVTLVNLRPQTSYSYKVVATDAAGNATDATGQMITMEEPDRTPPIVTEGPSVTSVSDTRVTISWKTNELANTFVNYGLDVSVGQKAGDAEYVLDHQVVLTNLAAETEYYYQIGSEDKTANEVLGEVATFSTLDVPDLIPPGTPVGITGVAGNQEVFVSWSRNADPDCAGYNIERAEGDGQFRSVATLVKEPSLLETGLVNGRLYRYRVIALDNAVPPNQSTASGEVQLTPAEANVATAPLLIRPASDEKVATETPNLVIGDAQAGMALPEAQLTYSFVVYADSALSRPVSLAASIPAGWLREKAGADSGQTVWHVSPPLGEAERTYWWRVRANDGVFNGLWSDVKAFAYVQPAMVEQSAQSAPDRDGVSSPQTFALEPNAPNPFNPETLIRYRLPVSTRIHLAVYDIAGQEIRTLVEGHVAPGYHAVKWDGRDRRGMLVASGIYFYKLDSPSFRMSRKMVLLK